jgi:LPXTG-motif cell wall-anchored protein
MIFISVNNNPQTKEKSMIMGLLIGLVGGFVFGVLFGRRNKKKVEAAVDKAKKLSGGKL